MLNLAFIFHMHQPYYKNLLTNETDVPWVRLHGVKDYLDMVQILAKYPLIRQTFNVVPSLFEQVEDYVNHNVKDVFLELSNKAANRLTSQEKEFILDRFFSINKERVIAVHPRYYELYLKKANKRAFSDQDFLDLQVWFNLAWTDPYFRDTIPELKRLVEKGRYYTEEEKLRVLVKQVQILEGIIPVYKKFQESGQIEVTVSPYYHPILPLLYNTKLAKEANPHAALPGNNFSFPDDAKAQIDSAMDFYLQRFGRKPSGMWPSEEAVCEHILPYIIQSGIKWIVSDEALLFKSIKHKKRDTELLYQPHLLKREDGELTIVFRDRNLSDLIGFVYHRWNAKDAVTDFMKHLENTYSAFKGRDILLTLAMDGENAWEYYANDGYDFLDELYTRLSESDFVKTTTVDEYLKMYPAKNQIKRLAAGSWIFGDFGKWIGNPYKIKAWEYLAAARQEFESEKDKLNPDQYTIAWKQMQVLEGSDWYWWYGEDPNGDFDKLFRMHMTNFYAMINKPSPQYLSQPISLT